MSAGLYEVLALSARYLFALLGVLIVLRAFIWLMSGRMARNAVLRRLPGSGYIGELVVLSGDGDLREGQSIPVPWEGILGSVRSSDICVPCTGVRRSHLRFSFEQGRGLLLRPFSGSEVLVNSVLLNCRSLPESAPLTHGGFLQVGQALLRLRVFAGLDPSAGFDDLSRPAPVPSGYPIPVVDTAPDSFTAQPPLQEEAGHPSPSVPVIPSPVPQFPAAPACDQSAAGPSALSQVHLFPEPDAKEPEQGPTSAEAVIPPASSRRRRRDRWEADWSE